MKYLQQHPQLFKLIPDPYRNGRICFEGKFWDRTTMHQLLDDRAFQRISDNVAYFAADAMKED